MKINIPFHASGSRSDDSDFASLAERIRADGVGRGRMAAVILNDVTGERTRMNTASDADLALAEVERLRVELEDARMRLNDCESRNVE